MPSTRTWLIIMLWAIGLGAFTGVVGVLFAPHSEVYRVMGTCFLLAGGALFMMLASRFVDREATRGSGLLAMWLVLIIFFLSLGLIWDFDRVITAVINVQGWRVQEGMAATIGWLLLTGVPAVVCVRLMRTEHSRIAGVLGIALAAVTFALLFSATVMYVFDWATGYRGNRAKTLMSGLWIGSMGLIAVGCLVGSKRLFVRPFVWIGVLASVVAAAMAIYGICLEVSTTFGEDVVVCLISAGVLVCYANLILHFTLKPQHTWLIYATIAAALCTTVTFDVYVIIESQADRQLRELLERMIVAGVILTASGTLAIAILSRLHRPLAIERSTELIREITIICPMCRTKQSMPAGQQSACRSCGLRIEIKIAEPRCPQCDYLLYHIESNRCPECGFVLNREAVQAADVH